LRELIISDELAIPLAEIDMRTSRSSGPGGQHANVTASRVEAVFDAANSPTLSEAQRRAICSRLGPRVTAVAQDARGQARNRELALERLAAKLERALRRRRARRPTRPTRAAKERRLAQKKQRSQRKRDRRFRGDE
jgi:ribosome-associated protein